MQAAENVSVWPGHYSERFEGHGLTWVEAEELAFSTLKKQLVSMCGPVCL